MRNVIQQAEYTTLFGCTSSSWLCSAAMGGTLVQGVSTDVKLPISASRKSPRQTPVIDMAQDGKAVKSDDIEERNKVGGNRLGRTPQFPALTEGGLISDGPPC